MRKIKEIELKKEITSYTVCIILPLTVYMFKNILATFKIEKIYFSNKFFIL